MLRHLIFLTAIIAAPILAQDDLPDLPGKAVTVRACTACHGAEMWSASHRSGDDWDRTITSMTEKGLAISDADYTAVLDYLTKALGPQIRVNVNKATASEIAKALGVSQAQAEAIVAYRTKNGPFKDVDGVKKVEGVAGAVDAHKDLIQF